jgi:two-component system, cell cycle sensor histidine kinase and response regulator CckA
MGPAAARIEVLLVDDDDEDYLLTRDMLARLDGARHELHRVSDPEAALRACRCRDYDVCLVDYRLGREDGIQLVRDLIADGHAMPIIVLTGQGDHDVDVEAAEAGAADYLVKGEISPTLLERTIRYSIRSYADLRALRKREEELWQAQKIEAVGRLAGGIAHDFNNLLAVIRGYTGIVLPSIDDEKSRLAVTRIDQAAARAAELTGQLLAFSRRQVLQPEVCDLNLVVEETTTMLERLLGDDILLDRRLDPGLAPVLVDRGQVAQVILNLAVNAREAMPDGGTIAIRTENRELDAAHVDGHANVGAGSYVLVEIADSGVGMDEATRRRVFEPFFTTKETGTGLGLSTVHGIVKQSGGHILLDSEPGTGTTFKVYFPATNAPVQPVESPVEQGSLEGDETILVVEDADMLRSLVADVLESFGYTVLTAANGRQAIELVESARTPKIDLLLTDVVMPQMNGTELAERLAAIEPDLHVLFTSGYPSDMVVRRGIAGSRTAFLQKPYVARDLAHKVREALAG